MIDPRELADELNKVMKEIFRAEHQRRMKKLRADIRRQFMSALRYMGLIPAVVFCVGTANAFPAIVYSVHDGDTVSLYTDTGRLTCRTAGDDAPEDEWKGRWGTQPYADQSRAALSDMIMGQTVEVEDTGQRSYGRTVCRITATIDGKPTDVQREMVFQGAAWSATQFEPAKDRDQIMPTLELDAQEHHRGLWHDPHPVAPWDWRHEEIGR